jgi:hypothetical protein
MPKSRANGSNRGAELLCDLGVRVRLVIGDQDLKHRPKARRQASRHPLPLRAELPHIPSVHRTIDLLPAHDAGRRSFNRSRLAFDLRTRRGDERGRAFEQSINLRDELGESQSNRVGACVAGHDVTCLSFTLGVSAGALRNTIAGRVPAGKPCNCAGFSAAGRSRSVGIRYRLHGNPYTLHASSQNGELQ